MQNIQSDLEQGRRVGVDEQYIKFRPSPNFRNMKKFLKSKIDINETMDKQLSPNIESDSSRSPASETKEQPKPTVQPPPKTIHPPLPLDPPPPDSPPLCLSLTLKKEIEELEEEIAVEQESHGELITEFKTDKTEEPPEKKPPICRDFIRGTCTRPGTCKYAHKYDVSQLAGVYTFCRNYQNTKCTFPTCKYVHATVFEEQRFYRTGILPTHALAHHKKNVNVAPPPPPPPEDSKKTEIHVNFSNPPPSFQNGIENPPLINSLINSSSKSKSPHIEMGTPLKNIEIKSHEWTDLSSHIQHELACDGKTVKKCPKCEMMEYRLQYNKERLEKLMKSSQENLQKFKEVTRKNHKLYTLLLVLLKPQAGRLNLTPYLANRPDKEKVLEQIRNFLKDRPLAGMMVEDNNKFGLNGT